MGNKLKPALIGGVIAGVLSIIPVLGIGCCLWAMVGGAVAVYLYVKNSPVPVASGQGAVVGALAGVVGAVIAVLVNLATVAMSQAAMAAMEAQFRERGIEMPVGGMGLVFLSTLMMGVILIAFAAIGGLIGTAIFEKRKGGDGGTMPPPTYGGGQPGGGYGANT